MITLSHSEMKTWFRCPRQWLVLYYLCLAPATEPVTGNRLLGIRVHTALEGWYGYGLDPSLVLQVIYTMLIEGNPDDARELAAEWSLAKIMVTGYQEWVEAEGKDADLEVVGVESQVLVPLPGIEDVMLRARLDQVVRVISDGTLRFLDHKTAAGFEKHELLELDTQMPFYSFVQHLAAARAQTPMLVTGGYLNTLRRVQRSSRSKPPYYQRDPFTFSPAKLDSVYRKTVQAAREIKAARYLLDQVFEMQGRVGTPAIPKLDELQQAVLRPVPIMNDCSWSCPLSAGQCTMMDDGSDWLAALLSSGHWKRVDPYAHYSDDALSAIRAELANPGGAA